MHKINSKDNNKLEMLTPMAQMLTLILAVDKI